MVLQCGYKPVLPAPSKGGAFTAFKLSPLTLAIPQRDLFFFLALGSLLLICFCHCFGKRISIFLYAQSVHRYIMCFLLSYILCDCRIIQSNCRYIIPFRPKVSVAKFLFQIRMHVKHHQCTLSFQISHEWWHWNLRRYAHKHMDMVGHQMSLNNLYSLILA